MLTSITRPFPLPTIQCGAVLGNGETGVLVWGGGRTLNLTLGNGALWDHRGGSDWTPEQHLTRLTTALQSQDMAGIREMFACKAPESVHRATLVPLARLVIILPENLTLREAETDFRTGIVTVRCTAGVPIVIAAAMAQPDIALTQVPAAAEIELKPAWDLAVGQYAEYHNSEFDTLAQRGFTAPVRFSGGFIQPFPADPAAAVVFQRRGCEVHCAVRRGLADEAAVRAVTFTDFSAAAAQSESYYSAFMGKMPVIETPDLPLLGQIYAEGAFRYAAASNPAGVSPGLQGGFLEDDRLAPWSGDYHFNINVQMVNSPGLKLNSPANIRKLFDLVLSWEETLHRNAECFVSEPEGIMLSHAADDRGRPMGGFWTGAIDHACSAWLAKLMVEYCDIYGDTEFLKNRVWNFMLGVMQVYRKLLSRRDGKLFLPVTVSPEYRDCELNAWGVNASFQLAALHNLAGNLIRTAAQLGRPCEPLWQEIEQTLPSCSCWEDPVTGPEIALWEGLPLRESHRHHSHLAGIFPFKTIDPLSPENARLIAGSLKSWTKLGMGSWTGWCVPWASVIRTRCGQPDMAVALLELWHRFFTNQGGASLHDSPFQGFTEWADFRGEIMQLDGGMGAVFAVSELFIHEFQGELRCFFGIPRSWKYAGITGIVVPGGFTFSGVWENGRPVRLKFTASREAVLRLRLPEPSPLLGNSDRLERPMRAGGELLLS